MGKTEICMCNKNKMGLFIFVYKIMRYSLTTFDINEFGAICWKSKKNVIYFKTVAHQMLSNISLYSVLKGGFTEYLF